MLQLNCRSGALGITQAVTFTKDGVDYCFLTLFGLSHFYRTISTGRGTSTASHAFLLIHFTNGA